MVLFCTICGKLQSTFRTAERLGYDYLTWRFRHCPKTRDDLSVVLDSSELNMFDRSYHTTPSNLGLRSRSLDKTNLKHVRHAG